MIYFLLRQPKEQNESKQMASAHESDFFQVIGWQIILTVLLVFNCWVMSEWLNLLSNYLSLSFAYHASPVRHKIY